ncbi:hypothetical protein IWX49DRAFT_190945 [Phyllosticta citricarpa]|uniref:Uncharacterized protein n=1 Tax=Phyllosticta citricarpa TaxID=55181 RepID=A0ABR1M647_9PEZI
MLFFVLQVSRHSPVRCAVSESCCPSRPPQADLNKIKKNAPSVLQRRRCIPGLAPVNRNAQLPRHRHLVQLRPMACLQPSPYHSRMRPRALPITKSTRAQTAPHHQDKAALHTCTKQPAPLPSNSLRLCLVLTSACLSIYILFSLSLLLVDPRLSLSLSLFFLSRTTKPLPSKADMVHACPSRPHTSFPLRRPSYSRAR